MFEWETDEERLKKSMSLSPKQKLEWLHQIHEFTWKASTDKDKLIRWKLRNIKN